MTIWEELRELAARKLAEAGTESEIPRQTFGQDDRRRPDEDSQTSKPDWIEGQKKICDSFNRTRRGDLTGHDCPDCLNRGYFFRVDETGRRYTEECRCMAARRNLWRIEASGLGDLVGRYTFDTWNTPEQWQRELLDAAKRYAADPEGWFAVCGRSGSGKTHICTAICGELMHRGLEVRYMLWRELGTQIKAAVREPETYRKLVDPLKTAKVLYIDDLFKTGKGQEPTTADVSLAFELLNYRYNTKGLFTLISSEMVLNEILMTDEAVGSRIYERTKERRNYFDLSKKQNWRMREDT